MASCDKIETITHSLKITGAKGDLFPGSFVITGANAPVALVESAPMYLSLGIFTAIFV